MAKPATLDDLILEIKKQNNQQSQTNKALHEVAMAMKEEAKQKKKKEQKDRADSKFPSGGKSGRGDNNEFLGSLFRGDLLGAIFGGASAVALTLFGGLAALVNASNTIQETIFDPLNERLKKTTKDMRQKMATAALFFTGLETIFGSFTKIGKFVSGIIRVIPGTQLITGPLTSFKNLFLRVDAFIKSIIKFSPTSLFGIIASLGKMFRWLLVLDIALKSLLESIKTFRSTPGTFMEKFLASIMTFFDTFIKELYDAVINAIPDAVKAISWFFDKFFGTISWFFNSFLGSVQNLNIPILTEVVGFIRASYQIIENIFLWFKELIMSNKQLVSFFSNLAKPEFYNDIIKSVTDMGMGVLKVIQAFVITPVLTILTNLFKSLGISQSILNKAGKLLISGVNGFLDIVKSILNFIKPFVESLGFKMPDRMPWEKDAKQKESEARIAKQKSSRAEEMERKSEEKKKAEMAYQQSLTVVVADSSIRNSTTTAVNNSNIMPFMQPAGYNPAMISDFQY